MKEVWGETEKEKEEEAASEDAFTEMTDFFCDLVSKIQLRQVICIYCTPFII